MKEMLQHAPLTSPQKWVLSGTRWDIMGMTPKASSTWVLADCKPSKHIQEVYTFKAMSIINREFQGTHVQGGPINLSTILDRS